MTSLIRNASLVLVVALAVPSALAQKRMEMYGARGYDKSKEVTLSGTIEKVEQHSGVGSKGVGIHVWLKTDAEPVEIHVAPKDFLDQEGFALKIGERLTVVGAKARFEDEEVIVAREVKTAERALTLRDEDGKPAWAGRSATR